MNTVETNETREQYRYARNKHRTDKRPWIIVFILLVVIMGFIIWQLFLLRPTTAETSTDVVDYSAKAEIQEALRILKNDKGQADVITQDSAKSKKVALTFDGMVDPATMQSILDLLKQYDMTATFFVTGLEAAEDPAVIKNIVEANHEVGSYTLRAEKHMESMSQEYLVNDFCSAAKILEVITDNKPEKLKCNVTEYSDPLLEAAYASGFKSAVKSTVYLNYQSFSSYEDTKAYVDSLVYKSIVTVKLEGVLDASEYEPKVVIESPAIDKEPSAPTPQPTLQEEISKEERLLRVVEWLLIAIQDTTYSEGTELLCIKNCGKLAEPVNNLRTSEAAVGYTFYGLDRIDELIGVLDQLKAVEGVGTFFVTAEEIEGHPEQIEMLMDSGQALGIAVYPQEGADVQSACFEMLNAKTLLEEKFDYNDVHLVMQPWGEVSDAVKEAASAIGCQMVAQDLAVARENNKDEYSAQQLMKDIFGENDYGIKRGEIVCFRMNYFNRSGLLGEFIGLLNETRNVYPIKDVYLIINSTGLMFEYPLPTEDILAEVKDKIYSGQLKKDLIDVASEYYIGNKDINTSAQLPGFSSSEISRLDRVGRIKNDENLVFLTFDDWGTDMSITKILDVLKKHDVKATFFIRSRYVVDNPNLLRAIAVEGHSIASHTHNHLPLAIDPKNNWHFVSITEDEEDVLKKDICDSYETLQSIVGDVVLENGRPALSRIFRPPTLAVSKTGMEAVFDCGFTYIVNGDYTTHDYEAKSAEELFKELKSNVKIGSVVVMHMSSNSVFTAEALDLFLTYNEQKPVSKRFSFARLPDYLEADYEK